MTTTDANPTPEVGQVWADRDERTTHAEFVRRIAANGRTLHHSQGYATRRGAVRAARRAGDEAGLWVHVLDGDTPPRSIRTYPPRRQGGAR